MNLEKEITTVLRDGIKSTIKSNPFDQVEKKANDVIPAPEPSAQDLKLLANLFNQAKKDRKHRCSHA